MVIDRRGFLKQTGGAIAGAAMAWASGPLGAQPAPNPLPPDFQLLYPRNRIPLSFIIDDSTCLVNMGHFCMPQFAAAWPDRDIYKRPWQSWPREIPDDFVREFGEWCGEHGVKGKYSIVPYPALVGWLDRELPGWSRQQLQSSLKLVRELMVPNWDIHPEMITHTRVIDIRTGRPMEEISSATMENSYPQEKKSVDELAAYLAYALQILKNCDLPCEGITTPGGFGNAVKSELSLAVHDAVRDVYGCEIPHYFKYVADGNESTEPRLEHVRDAGTDDPKVTVSVLAGTGDWFGGWDGDETSQGDRYANADATSGRMVELIERGQPAIMLCHWPGLYTHGAKKGFEDFKRVVVALEGRFRDQMLWMKLSDIARYWAVRGLASLSRSGDRLQIRTPFATRLFTIRVAAREGVQPRVFTAAGQIALREVQLTRDLDSGTWIREAGAVTLCFDLEKGETVVRL